MEVLHSFGRLWSGSSCKLGAAPLGREDLNGRNMRAEFGSERPRVEAEEREQTSKGSVQRRNGCAHSARRSQEVLAMNIMKLSGAIAIALSVGSSGAAHRPARTPGKGPRQGKRCGPPSRHGVVPLLARPSHGDHPQGDQFAQRRRNRTESNNPKVVEKLQAHVASMYKRVEERRPIHARDPLFAEIFRNSNKIKMKLENTKTGVKIVETSQDPYVAKLIQAHAEVVNLFLKNGRQGDDEESRSSRKSNSSFGGRSIAKFAT